MWKTISVLFLSFVAMTQFAFGSTFHVDTAHSQVRFTVSHMMLFKVRGAFNEFTGTIEADPAKKSISAVNGKVTVGSVNTRDDKRDGHLKSPDFFDMKNHPELTFVSKSVSGSGGDITVVGDLTIRGITKEVTFKGEFMGATKDPWGMERAGFEATATVNRKDFGLEWNKALETGGVLVGDKVEITLEVQAVNKG